MVNQLQWEATLMVSPQLANARGVQRVAWTVSWVGARWTTGGCHSGVAGVAIDDRGFPSSPLPHSFFIPPLTLRLIQVLMYYLETSTCTYVYQLSLELHFSLGSGGNEGLIGRPLLAFLSTDCTFPFAITCQLH